LKKAFFDVDDTNPLFQENRSAMADGALNRRPSIAPDHGSINISQEFFTMGFFSVLSFLQSFPQFLNKKWKTLKRPRR
jgi:hypothetical protein